MSIPAFAHLEARSFREVARLARRGDVMIAGGTDLVPLMRDGLVTPRAVVDLKTIRGAGKIRAGKTGAALGPLALLADIAEHPGVRRWFPALAQACLAVGTTQIRNMATLGGNLCQRNRCWYFRQNVPCHKTGGRGCPAVDGLNEYLSILGGGPCHAPHPSDPAVALAALDARVHVRFASGRAARLSIADLYRDAAKRRDAETVLGPGDVIERISLPAKYAGARQRFLKTAQREMWDFALVSVGVVRPRGRTPIPRLVLGGVAPRPWEIEIREAGSGRQWAARMAAASLAEAKALSQNAYKVELARNLIVAALTGGG
ncbi:MAG: FAD binding domain-containing protein [Gemmatimonadales bacterium]